MMLIGRIKKNHSLERIKGRQRDIYSLVKDISICRTESIS